MRNIYRHSDAITRRCSRCGLPLEDAASREYGQGPICRNKNNKIFARQIPADLTKANLIILDLNDTDFHSEISNKFEDIRSSYLKKVERVASQQEGNVGIILSGADFRPIVDWFDFALSYPIKNSVRTNIINFIEYLGYQALAGVLRGDVCMSPAKLYINNDSLYLSAKSSKQGFYAMKRNIPNIITPRFRGDKTPYQCSIKYVSKFVELAYRYWPFLEISEDVQKALESTSIENVMDDTKEDQKPSVRLIDNSGWINIKVPWSGTKEDMQNIVNKFKEIPKGDRSYNPRDYSWSFKTNYKPQIVNILKDKYSILYG